MEIIRVSLVSRNWKNISRLLLPRSPRGILFNSLPRPKGSLFNYFDKFLMTYENQIITIDTSFLTNGRFSRYCTQITIYIYKTNFNIFWINWQFRWKHIFNFNDSISQFKLYTNVSKIQKCQKKKNLLSSNTTVYRLKTHTHTICL